MKSIAVTDRFGCCNRYIFNAYAVQFSGRSKIYVVYSIQFFCEWFPYQIVDFGTSVIDVLGNRFQLL